MDFNLTSEQEEILVNFQAITDNWDLNFALDTLTRCDWDLQRATSETLSYARMQESPLENYQEISYIPAPEPVQMQTARPAVNEKKGFFSKVRALFSELVPSQLPLISPAADDFQRLVGSFASQYKPKFGNKMLMQMLEEAKNTKKMLLMYIHCDEVPIEYIKEVFCNELSAMIINQYYIAWGVFQDSTEGRVAEQVLKATGFPCLAAVKVDDPSRPVVLEKLEGQHPCEKIIEFLSRNYVSRPVIAYRNRALEEERKIRAKQEKELKEAERLHLHREMEERKKKEEEQKRILDEKLEKEKEENEKKRKMMEIGDEPVDGEIACLSFRLPNGSKIERKFDKNRQVKVLYDYLEAQGLKNFEVLYGFPAVVLGNKNATLEESGLYPKALVIVRNA
ncbi:hypothetical protein SteCoe_27865 [Stentor coeruleus]|uniref:UBX domain-containing protein n=1 Tax=Stentor coeruleus TaxID=5963 RepID=A0A1R2B9I7_9CILI|nr:hypothetical protein SteCoe_27865 [Stentor coeruleus]